MNTASVLKKTIVGAKVIDLVSYLAADNDRLRQTAAELTARTAALRQKLERAQEELATPPAKGEEDPRSRSEGD